MSANIVTRDAVAKLIDDIVNATKTPFIFVDLEGINLSRQGSISIMQLLMPPAPVVHLVDVFRLQGHAFDTVGTTENTLRDLLESERYVKIFLDVRNDSDALFSHFRVNLNGVIDLQLIEYA
jgi:exonuclease 3'-5' domain-containing protein 1